MKFSAWAKEYDKNNPGKIRVMNHEELMSITVWDNQFEHSKPEEPINCPHGRTRRGCTAPHPPNPK